jgi:hypothetical protein
MTRILTLDAATCTGWCVTESGHVIASGILQLDAKLPKQRTGDKFIRRPAIYAEAYVAYSTIADTHEVDWVVVEDPHLRGEASLLTVSLHAIAQLVAHRRQAGFYSVRTSEWQSRIIPKTKGSDTDTKDRSLAHVRSAGFEPATHDEADAICVAEYVHKHLEITGGQTPWAHTGRVA